MAKRVGRPKTGVKPNTSIRVDPDILHQARVAAVIQRKTMGRWLEEAILEKIEREQKSADTKLTVWGMHVKEVAGVYDDLHYPIGEPEKPLNLIFEIIRLIKDEFIQS